MSEFAAPRFNFIYLASQSPRRRELLEQIGVRYDLLLPGAQDDAEALEMVWPDEKPASYVQRVTRAKLEAALLRHQQQQLPLAPILCADTTVALDNVIYGKPQDNEDAECILMQLQGRTHQVLTSVAVVLPENGAKEESQMWQRLSISSVALAVMTEREMESYIQSGEAQGKAGAYGIQGRMAAYVASMEGSFSGVVGLPLYETAQLLQLAGVVRS